MMVAGLALGRWPVIAVAGACIAYVSVLSLTGGWPPEMRDKLPHGLVRLVGLIRGAKR
jgi:hypothetical protein